MIGMLKNNIILSIVIPIYNKEKYLRMCLDSLVRQKFDSSVEIIMINDGSTDRSLEICREYEKYNNFRLFSTENRGVSAARNYGLDNSVGKYIAWVDPDDYVSNNWYKEIKQYIFKDFDIIFFDNYYVDGIKNIKDSFGNGTSYIDYNVWINKLNSGEIKSHLWSKVIKKKFWEKVRFPLNLSFGEDFYVLPRVTRKCKKIIYINKCLYYYVKQKDSITNNKTKEFDNMILEIELCNNRFNYLLKEFKLKPIGVIDANLKFMWKYLTAEYYLKKKYSNQYNESLIYIRKKSFIYICNIKIPIKRKLKLVLLTLGITECIANLFAKVYHRLYIFA